MCCCWRLAEGCLCVAAHMHVGHTSVVFCWCFCCSARWPCWQLLCFLHSVVAHAGFSATAVAACSSALPRSSFTYTACMSLHMHIPSLRRGDPRSICSCVVGHPCLSPNVLVTSLDLHHLFCPLVTCKASSRPGGTALTHHQAKAFSSRRYTPLTS